ncbi:MAG: hypothetical protein JXA62_07710 [Candidatus Aminicenantes bacterium]|nr:hypothetical protein [Candidatus Aminicenantes bacterium]
MKKSNVSVLLWIIACCLTLVIAVFQRVTGPTWPVRGEAKFNNVAVEYRFLRSQTADTPLEVRVKTRHDGLNLRLNYRRFRSNDTWHETGMRRDGNGYVAFIPGQPPAGKIEYQVYCGNAAESKPLLPSPIVARFKGRVPAVWLILHILFMMSAILLCARTGLECLRPDPRLSRLVAATLAAVILGGLVFGPLVQHFAFGDLWTGFPMGTDLTDNKTLVMFLFWLAAFFLYRRSRWWVFTAAVLTLAVTLIPHSVWGSELDYEGGGMRNKFSLPVQAPPQLAIKNRRQTGPSPEKNRKA